MKEDASLIVVDHPQANQCFDVEPNYLQAIIQLLIHVQSSVSALLWLSPSLNTIISSF